MEQETFATRSNMYVPQFLEFIIYFDKKKTTFNVLIIH